MPYPISDILKTEKNKLSQKDPWLTLVEVEGESHSNLLLHSEDLRAAEWVKSNCAIAYGDPAPDGNPTASQINTTGAAEIYQDYIIADPENRTFTFSVLARRWDASPAGLLATSEGEEIITSEGDHIIVSRGADGWAGLEPDSLNFKLKLRRGDDSDETVLTGDQIKWIPYRDKWFRGSITKTFSSSTTGDNVRAVIACDAASMSFYIWGDQLEEQAGMSLYLPTVAAAVTSLYHHLVNHVSFISWHGFCFTPFPVQVGPFRASTKGEVPTVSVSVSNVGGYLSGYMKRNNGLIGMNGNFYLVHKSALVYAENLMVPEKFIITGSSRDNLNAIFQLSVGVCAYGIKGPKGKYDCTNSPAMPIVNPRTSVSGGVI